MSSCDDIRTLAKHMLDLTVVIDKMDKDIESLKETQKHLQEVMPMIKQMDYEPRRSISHPEFKR
jgi:ketosteroid isomerase-like protein